MTPEERATSLHDVYEHPPGALVVVHRGRLIEAIRAAENDALERAAKRLDELRPSPVQMKISPEYNGAMVRGLEVAATEVRAMKHV